MIMIIMIIVMIMIIIMIIITIIIRHQSHLTHPKRVFRFYALPITKDDIKGPMSRGYSHYLVPSENHKMCL